jgi:hypothetical protein
MVPAWSHKPNDAGSSPAPATKVDWKQIYPLTVGRADITG